MNKTNKIVIIFYVFFIISYVCTMVYIDRPYADLKLPQQEKKSINEIILVKTTNVNKTKIFNTMANIQNYPLIIPDSVLSVNILNQTNNVIYAEVMEKYFKTKFLVKQTLIPYGKQTLEVVDGDAKGTMITETLEQQTSSNTTLTTDVKLKLKGVLAGFVYLSESQIKKGLEREINNFISYSRGFNNKYEKTVDDLYREILYRPADPAGLNHYASLLQSGKMTTDDIRKELLLSDEAKYVLKPDEWKTVDKLSDETKKMVNQFYTEILGRSADPQGLVYYGSLLESGKMTADDVKNTLYNSDEAVNVRLQNPTMRQIDDVYVKIFHKHANEQTLNHYYPLLQSKNMTLEKLENELNSTKLSK